MIILKSNNIDYYGFESSANVRMNVFHVADLFFPHLFKLLIWLYVSVMCDLLFFIDTVQILQKAKSFPSLS